MTIQSRLEALRALLEKSTPAPFTFCNWHQDDQSDCTMWETSCGNAFEFNDEGPKANGMLFCGYCGKLLTESRTSDDEP